MGRSEGDVRVMQRLPIRLPHRVIATACVVALAFAASACERTTDAPKPLSTSTSSSDEWREFEGTWNAAGSRRTIPLGDDRKGSIIDLRGSMLLSGAERPNVGFHCEVIALVDSATGLVGRAVWTDEHGDQVFSDLKGEGTKEKNRIMGTILGGTGRYAGGAGAYEFSWQFVMEGEDGAIQGRAVGLKGRVKPGQANAGGARP